jgi:hypothetical protein
MKFILLQTRLEDFNDELEKALNDGYEPYGDHSIAGPYSEEITQMLKKVSVGNTTDVEHRAATNA